MADQIFDSFLVHTCSIVRGSRTPGLHKRPVRGTSTVATGVSCRVKPLRAIDRRYFETPDGVVIDADYKIYFPPETDIQEKDQVVVGSGPMAGTYDVEEVEQAGEEDGTVVHHYTTFCKRQSVTHSS